MGADQEAAVLPLAISLQPIVRAHLRLAIVRDHPRGLYHVVMDVVPVRAGRVRPVPHPGCLACRIMAPERPIRRKTSMARPRFPFDLLVMMFSRSMFAFILPRQVKIGREDLRDLSIVRVLLPRPTLSTARTHLVYSLLRQQR